MVNLSVKNLGEVGKQQWSVVLRHDITRKPAFVPTKCVRFLLFGFMKY